MNKKILIGSIIAVVILVLVSFTGVVGYQTTKSSTIAKASPLFSVRSKRAIDEESKDLTCDYVGKGEESVLSIPKRDDKKVLQQKFIDSISKMDDKTFKRFLNLIINQMQKNDEYDDVNINEVITAIHQLRDNPDRISLNVYKNGNYTWRYEFTPTYCWFPFCFFYEAIIVIIWALDWIYYFIFIFTHNHLFPCEP
ncbi:MAG: hypothetical protein KAJ44_04205 [Thermoplasmatales archaeon]|nr:hypothetical protein [Thermoplasmatales archaeon]